MRTTAVGDTVVFEDDMERFFRRSAWQVSNADVWRWRAACAAAREMMESSDGG